MDALRERTNRSAQYSGMRGLNIPTKTTVADQAPLSMKPPHKESDAVRAAREAFERYMGSSNACVGGVSGTLNSSTTAVAEQATREVASAPAAVPAAMPRSEAPSGCARPAVAAVPSGHCASHYLLQEEASLPSHPITPAAPTPAAAPATSVAPAPAQETRAERLERLRRQVDGVKREAADVDSEFRREQLERLHINAERRREDFEKKKAAEARQADRLRRLQEALEQMNQDHGKWDEARSERCHELPNLKRLLERIASMKRGQVFDMAQEAQRWAAFEETAAERLIGLDDLPMPQGPSQLSNADFKQLALRFHPDKFMQRWGDRIIEEEVDAVIEAVVEVFKVINNNRAS